MNETELVIAAQQGDIHAFGELYALYERKLYHYALYRLADRDDAMDAVQDCALRAWESLTDLKHPEAFSAWLFKILSRCCNRKIKEQITRRKNDDIEDYAQLLSADCGSLSDRLALERALELLSEKDRDIVLLSVVAGLQSKEVARIVKKSPANVRQRLHRSLQKMRSELKE